MNKTKKQIETLFTMAKERNLSPMWTHYYRTRIVGKYEYKMLAATSCVLLNEDLKPVSRGVAVVSLKDNGAKAYGRLLSLKRAFRVVASDKVDTTEVLSTRKIEGLNSTQRKQARIDPADWETYVTDLEYDRVVNKIRREAKIKLEAYQASTKTMAV